MSRNVARCAADIGLTIVAQSPALFTEKPPEAGIRQRRQPEPSKRTIYGLLLTHGQHVMAIDATAKRAWADEADMCGQMVKHIYTLSDALVDGIAKQFPNKFQ